MDCIFCQIVEGKIPAQRVQENENFVSFLDINPLTPGHTLVLPRRHLEVFTELPRELAAELFAVTQDVAKAVIKATRAEGYNLLSNNHKCAAQAIPHVHVHVIPRRSGDGVKFNWEPKPYGEGEADRVAESIREALAGRA